MLWAQLSYCLDKCNIFGRYCRVSCRYHSHPIFAPKPSQKDNENQRNYQALFRCATSTLEPFLGAIVGPYDVQLPSPVRKTPGCCMPCLAPIIVWSAHCLRVAQAFVVHYFSPLFHNGRPAAAGFMHHLVCRADSARRPGALPCADQSKRTAGASR